MNEDILKRIEANTARTASNAAFQTWVLIIILAAMVLMAFLAFDSAPRSHDMHQFRF